MLRKDKAKNMVKLTYFLSGLSSKVSSESNDNAVESSHGEEETCFVRQPKD